MDRKRKALCVMLVLSSALVPGWGQVLTGTITGSVVDASTSAVPGAAINVIQVSTGAETRTTTNERGDFVVTGLAAGDYKVVVEMAGFKGLQRENIVLTSAERLPLGNLMLEVGAAQDKVTVFDEAQAVQTASAERSATVMSSQISNLLIRGRNFTRLVS